MPTKLRCLIIGENPGDTTSQYFYEVPEDYGSDKVRVRRELLNGLYKQQLLSDPTLEGFKNAGFLFDHAIRCQLPPHEIKKQRVAAQRYKSFRVEYQSYLNDLIAKADIVWIMGHLANNAVANVDFSVGKQGRKISKPPFPGQLSAGSKYFVSSYFHQYNKGEMSNICAAFLDFAQKRGAFERLV